MNALKRIFLPVLAATAMEASAEGWYLGASVGVMDNDAAGFDDATNAGLLVGYDVFTREIFSVALEGEVTTTVADGDVDINGFRGDWDVDTQAAYVAGRIGDRFYIKVRYGAVREDVSVDVGSFSGSETDTNFSWSGALGWMFDRHWGVQLDGTLVEADLTYWNLGLRYQFQ